MGRGHRVKFIVRGKRDSYEYGYIAEKLAKLGRDADERSITDNIRKHQTIKVWRDFPESHGEVYLLGVRNIEKYAKFCHTHGCPCKERSQNVDYDYKCTKEDGTLLENQETDFRPRFYKWFSNYIWSTLRGPFRCQKCEGTGWVGSRETGWRQCNDCKGKGGEL